jgi:uncharacterized protein (DUF433 family)
MSFDWIASWLADSTRTAKPEVMGGKPCIKGTRIPVDLILRYLGDGQGVDDMLAAFPGLTALDVRAAAAVVADEAVVLEGA